MRQFFVFLAQTKAPPSPKPFSGGILPAAMCTFFVAGLASMIKAK